MIAIDVGGSSVKSGVVRIADRTGVTVATTPIDSRGKRDAILTTLEGVLRGQLRAVHALNLTCLGVGIGFPGPFDYERGVARLRGVDKYDALYGVNLRAAFGSVLKSQGFPLRFGNDAVCALLAEARYGEGRKHERILGIVLGTGLGSAFVVGGEQVMRGHGVPDGGFLWAEPFEGVTADEVFSTRGLQARLRRTYVFLDVPDAVAQARAGDPGLRMVFTGFGHDLGTFLTPYAADFRADALVLLGGLANTSDLFADGLVRQLPVPYYTSFLGARAGVIGASLLIEM